MIEAVHSRKGINAALEAGFRFKKPSLKLLKMNFIDHLLTKRRLIDAHTIFCHN